MDTPLNSTRITGCPRPITFSIISRYPGKPPTPCRKSTGVSALPSPSLKAPCKGLACPRSITLVWVVSPGTSGGVDTGESDAGTMPDTAEYAAAAGAERTPGFSDILPSDSMARAAAAAALFGSANGVQSGGPASNGDDLLRDRELSERASCLGGGPAGVVRLLLREAIAPVRDSVTGCCCLPQAGGELNTLPFAPGLCAGGFLSPVVGTVVAVDPGTAAVAAAISARAVLLVALDCVIGLAPGRFTPSVK